MNTDRFLVPDGPVTVARTTTSRGEVALTREHTRTPQTLATRLRVNGVLVMDSTHTATERALAGATLTRVTQPTTVVVAGLGLGFTVQAVLADRRVRRVEVVEIEPLVLRWLADGLMPETAGVLADPRVHVQLDDIRNAVGSFAATSVDAILLDVDNGPDQLVHPGNALLYEPAFLTACRQVVRPGGLVAVWSATPAPGLREAFGDDGCEVVELAVPTAGRRTSYYLYLAPGGREGSRQ